MAAVKKTATTREVPQTLRDHIFYGLKLDAKQAAFRDAIWSPDIDIVFVNAGAGCGKTLIATATANLLVNYERYKSITYITSPCSDAQGFLPGTLTEKSAVYFEPFYQALITIGLIPAQVINDETLSNQKNGTGYINCITHTYLRGSNLDGVVILDETQNFKEPELRKVLTRCCEGAKIICIGHSGQADIPRQLSGFERCINHFRGLDRVAVCDLDTNYRSWVAQHADLAW